jgi:hypothetical protein
MKIDIKYENSQELEIVQRLESPKKSRRWDRFSGLVKKMLNALFADPKEIQVNQKIDREGNIYWRVYDPVTGNSFSSGSETDVCMWIEQLYRY